MKKLLCALHIFLFSIFLGQENDSVFIYFENNPYEEIHSDKYTQEKLFEYIHLGMFGKRSTDNFYYNIYFGAPNRKANGEYLHPIIVKDRSYLECISKKWIDKDWVAELSVDEFIDYFDKLKGKEIYIISQYYLDKYPDKVLVFKSVTSGVNIPIY